MKKVEYNFQSTKYHLRQLSNMSKNITNFFRDKRSVIFLENIYFCLVELTKRLFLSLRGHIMMLFKHPNAHRI